MGEKQGQAWDGTIDFYFNGGRAGISEGWWNFVVTRVPDLRGITFDGDYRIIRCHVTPMSADEMELQRFSLSQTYEWIERVIGSLFEADMLAPGVTMDGHLAGLSAYSMRRMSEDEVAKRDRQIHATLEALGLPVRQDP